MYVCVFTYIYLAFRELNLNSFLFELSNIYFGIINNLSEHIFSDTNVESKQR